MKKLIITLAFVALSSVSAKAIEMGMFSITAGLGTNTSVWGGSATQDEYNTAGTAIKKTVKEHGVFTESFSSQIIEIGIGRWVSLGFEHVPDSITTPTNVNDCGVKGSTPHSGNQCTSDTASVSVDFNDFNTLYAKINTPWGLYFKAGTVETDVDIKETMLSGNTYANVSVSGTSVGAGYQKYIGETGFGIRVEGNYVDLDNATTNNGLAKTAADTNFKEVKATNLEGLTAKVALTYTFGRQSN